MSMETSLVVKESSQPLAATIKHTFGDNIKLNFMLTNSCPSSKHGGGFIMIWAFVKKRSTFLNLTSGEKCTKLEVIRK